MNEPRIHTVWYHPKTDAHYLILGVGTCSTDGPRERAERSVIYLSLSRREIRYREVSEFLDGRFVEVDPPALGLPRPGLPADGPAGDDGTATQRGGA